LFNEKKNSNNEGILFSIRNPTHPFISVLINNSTNDSLHQLVFNQIEIIFEQLSIDRSIQMLKPFFLHIFFESTESEVNMQETSTTLTQHSFKHLICQFLIKKKKCENSSYLTQLINTYFQHLKLKELGNVQLLESINEIIKCLTQSHDCLHINDETIKILIRLLIRINLNYSLNLTTKWNSLEKLINFNNFKFDDHHLLRYLASNLTRIEINNLHSYIQFCMTACSNFSTLSQNSDSIGSIITLYSFLPPLLEHKFLITNSKFQMIPKYNQLNEDVSKFIQLINTNTNDGTLTPLLSSNNILFSLKYYESDQEVNGRFVTDQNEQINRLNFNSLCSHFILNDNDDTNQLKTADFVQIFSEIINKWNFMSFIIFIIIVYKIKISKNSNKINNLITHLVDLVPLKSDPTVILTIFNSLLIAPSSSLNNSWSRNEIVKLVVIKQLTRLCSMNYDYIIYPTVQKFIFSLPSNAQRQSLYTKAFCIQELVNYKPDYYGLELLSTISNMLNTLNRDEDEGISAILIDTLACLCNSEVIDIKSAWTALNKNDVFATERRLLELNAYCRFVSVAANSLQTQNKVKEEGQVSTVTQKEEEEEETFEVKMLKLLWSLVKVNASDPKRRMNNSIFEALSKFNPQLNKCSYLPIEISNKIKIIDSKANKTKSFDQIFDNKIPSHCYIDLMNICLDSSGDNDGLRRLFESVLLKEIETTPRGRLFDAREKVITHTDQISKQNNIYKSIKTFLNNQMIKDSSTSTIKSQNNYIILYSYDPSIEIELSSKKMSSNASILYQKYNDKFEHLLNNFESFQIEDSNCSLITNGWTKFLKDLFKISIEAIQYENRFNKQNDNIDNIDDEPWCLSRSKLVETILHSFHQIKNKKPETINFYLIILLTLLNVTTGYVTDEIPTQFNNDSDTQTSLKIEKFNYNQRKFVEIIVDFILNSIENRKNLKTPSTTTSKVLPSFDINDIIRTFSRSKVHSEDFLKFIHELITNDNLNHSSFSPITYFLVSIQPACVKIKISKYLLQTLDTFGEDLLTKSTTTTTTTTMASLYIENKIKIHSQNDDTFNAEKNRFINDSIKVFYNKCLKSLSSTKTPNTDLLNSLTKCLSCLYNERSQFYDDDNILGNLLDTLKCEKVPNNIITLVFKVNITCIGYRANLITNEQLENMYNSLLNENNKVLLAFYCRFLVTFGYLDGLNWTSDLYNKWITIINNNQNDESSIFDVISSIKGVLTLIGASYNDGHFETIEFDQMTSMTTEIERILKPEATIKQIIKILPNIESSNEDVSVINDIKSQLSFMIYKFETSQFSDVYSTYNNYNYLGEYSLLNKIVNELQSLTKGNQFNLFRKNLKFLKFLLNSKLNLTQIRLK
jgi:hypothetical protein